MTIKHPSAADLPRLRQLWQEAFGDTDAFLDSFFQTAFHPERCLCAWEEGRLASAIYWFDCTLGGEAVAYLYALATDKALRGKGIAGALMAGTHAHLKSRGCKAALLVPGEPSLAGYYRSMGYEFCGGIRSFSCAAAAVEALKPLSAEEYASLRRQYLPENSVVQEGENLRFLAAQARFYAGEDFLLAARQEGSRLVCPELLGNAGAAPGIVAALGCEEGVFRMPGEDSFAMGLPLNGGKLPPVRYFAFAFD